MDHVQHDESHSYLLNDPSSNYFSSLAENDQYDDAHYDDMMNMLYESSNQQYSSSTMGHPMSGRWQRLLQRFLADEAKKYDSAADYYKDKEPNIDYSVLSVGVMTLGLIMIVELLRHRIDHAAKGRPFFKSVLEGVYTECTLY